MNEMEIKRAEGLMHAQWADVILKVHEGEIADPQVALLFVGWALKDFVRDNNVAGMGNKEVGKALDALLREQGYYIARLDEAEGA